jgi:hypothetical protein
MASDKIIHVSIAYGADAQRDCYDSDKKCYGVRKACAEVEMTDAFTELIIVR